MRKEVYHGRAVETKETGGQYSHRYFGSMVADLHRNLINGGIFMYPSTADNRNRKLRLQYECNPFAFIIEVAGGKATNGTERILDIQPKELHERTPLFIGSSGGIKKLLEMKKFR